jgi:ankyrin repeat protein
MTFIKRILFILIISSFIFPMSAFSSRKKVIDDEEAMKRQQELMEKRAKAEADIAARREQLDREEQERIEQERLEAERLEAERIAQEKAAEEEEQRRLEEEKLEAERLEKERLEQAALEEKRQQELLQQQLELELERQKSASEKNKKEYLSDYMIYDIETIDDVAADTDDYYRIANPDEKDAAGRTLLMRAAKSGNEWELKILIESGADVNLTDNDGWTALMYAVRYSEGLECVDSLLEAGADITKKNNYGSSALAMAATFNGNPQILNELLTEYKGSDKEVLRALILLLSEQNISERQQLTKLQLFMDKGVPLNVLYEGKTPLIYAAQYGNSTKVIQKLLDNQASVTLRSTEGKTAFDYAMNNYNLAHDETYWALNQR